MVIIISNIYYKENLWTDESSASSCMEESIYSCVLSMKILVWLVTPECFLIKKSINKKCTLKVCYWLKLIICFLCFSSSCTLRTKLAIFFFFYFKITNIIGIENEVLPLYGSIIFSLCVHSICFRKCAIDQT